MRLHFVRNRLNYYCEKIILYYVSRRRSYMILAHYQGKTDLEPALQEHYYHQTFGLTKEADSFIL